MQYVRVFDYRKPYLYVFAQWCIALYEVRVYLKRSDYYVGSL